MIHVIIVGDERVTEAQHSTIRRYLNKNTNINHIAFIKCPYLRAGQEDMPQSNIDTLVERISGIISPAPKFTYLDMNHVYISVDEEPVSAYKLAVFIYIVHAVKHYFKREMISFAHLGFSQAFEEMYITQLSSDIMPVSTIWHSLYKDSCFIEGKGDTRDIDLAMLSPSWEMLEDDSSDAIPASVLFLNQIIQNIELAPLDKQRLLTYSIGIDNEDGDAFIEEDEVEEDFNNSTIFFENNLLSVKYFVQNKQYLPTFNKSTDFSHYVVSIDFDGCADTDLGRKMIIDDMLRILREHPNIRYLVILIGSLRQSLINDWYNAQRNFMANGSRYLSCHVLGSDFLDEVRMAVKSANLERAIEVSFDPFLLSDILNNLEHGKTYKAMKRFEEKRFDASKGFFVETISKKIINMLAYSASPFHEQNAREFCDESKRVLLLTQTRRIKANYPHAVCLFKHYDDMTRVVLNVWDMFYEEPDLLPEGITFCSSPNYSAYFIQSNDYFELPRIEGKGTNYEHYPAVLLELATNELKQPFEFNPDFVLTAYKKAVNKVTPVISVSMLFFNNNSTIGPPILRPKPIRRAATGPIEISNPTSNRSQTSVSLDVNTDLSRIEHDEPRSSFSPRAK